MFDKDKYNSMCLENKEIMDKADELQDEFNNYKQIASSINPKASHDTIFQTWVYLKLAELSLGKKLNML
jgi:hypothetical protein